MPSATLDTVADAPRVVGFGVRSRLAPDRPPPLLFPVVGQRQWYRRFLLGEKRFSQGNRGSGNAMLAT
jgi:hypothetical protein